MRKTLLPDVNVWVALVFHSHAHHPAALAWFDGQGSLAITLLWMLAEIKARRCRRKPPRAPPCQGGEALLGSARLRQRSWHPFQMLITVHQHIGSSGRWSPVGKRLSAMARLPCGKPSITRKKQFFELMRHSVGFWVFGSVAQWLRISLPIIELKK